MPNNTGAMSQELKRLIDLGRSPELFLSAYLVTDPNEFNTRGMQLRLAAMLDEKQGQMEGTSLARAFQRERKSMEALAESFRPAGPGTVFLTSSDASKQVALSIPISVADRVRFGISAYVLPLLDVLDEFEPVALAFVERDGARLVAASAAQVVDQQQMEFGIQGMNRAGGGYSTGYQGSSATRISGGSAGDLRARHTLEQVNRHFDEAIEKLVAMHGRHGFRRLFVAGPAETRAQFIPRLPAVLGGLVAGEHAMDAHASDHTLLEALLEWNREAERIQERNLVEGIITGSQKGQNAVAGLDATLWALNRNELHLLILSGEFDRDGQHCANCDILLPMDHMLCPQCDQKLTRIDLREELTGYALRKGVELEVVHGDGAELLRAYDSIGGTLRITRH